jgi:ADP-ribose pyrophosphatase YjhB (NUDIX family)
MLVCMSDYVTTGQAAKAIGVSINALQQWAKDGLVSPAFTTPGGRMRWKVNELLAQLGGTAPVTPAAARPTAPPVPIVLAIITSRDGVVIGKRAEPPPPWSFPGGEIEEGESADDAAARVAQEDARLFVRPGVTIGQRLHPATNRLVTYIACAPSTRDRAVSVGDDQRYSEVKWASLSEATALLPDMDPRVLDHLKRVVKRR